MRISAVLSVLTLVIVGMYFSHDGSGDPAPSRILLPDLIDADTEYGPGNYELGGATFIDIGATVTFKAGSMILMTLIVLAFLALRRKGSDEEE